MGDNMNDDLGRHLRDEVPPPRSGYWESIDASLEEISEGNSDTTGAVVRPIGMNERRNALSTRLLAAAAAVAVIAAAGVFIATRDDGVTETDVATEVTLDEGPTTTVVGDGNGPTTTGDDQEPVTTIEALGFPALPAETERRCYADDVLNDWFVVAEFDVDGTMRAAMIDPDGAVLQTSGGVMFGAEGWYVINSELAEGDRVVQSWFVTEDSLTQAEDGFFQAIECSAENEDLVRAAEAAQVGVAAPADRNVNAERICFAGETPGGGGEVMRIDIEADGTASMTRRLDTGAEFPQIVYGPGYLVEGGSFAFDVTTAQDRFTEVYSLDNGGATFGLGFFFGEVLCDDVAAQFQDADGLDAADFLDGYEFRFETFIEDIEGTVVEANAVISGEADRYTVLLDAGQTVDFSLASLEDNAVFAIIGPGQYFFVNEAQSFSVEVPLSGEYQVIISPDRGNATYDLAITVS